MRREYKSVESAKWTGGFVSTRRREGRTEALDVPVVVHSDRPRRGCVTNLSAAGAYVAMVDPPELGELVELEFGAEDSKEKLRLLGEIRWRRPASTPSVGPAGAGIVFKKLGEEGLAHLRAMVGRKLDGGLAE